MKGEDYINMATDKKNKNLSSTDKSTRKLNDIGRDILNSILQNTYKKV